MRNSLINFQFLTYQQFATRNPWDTHENMSKKISNRFRAIVRVTQICADICGANVFDDNFRFNWRTVLVFGVINASLCFMSYTAYRGLVVEGDWRVLLQVLSIGGGTLIQGYCKLANAVRNQRKFRFLLNELYSVYDEYESKHSDYRLGLNKGIYVLSNLMKLSAFIAGLLVLGMALVTLFFAIVLKSRHLIVQCLVPGVDPNTDIGFIVTNMVQVCFLAVGGFGLYAGNMSFFTPMSQVAMLKDILRCKFHDLKEIINDEPVKDRKAFEALKDIIIFHQRYLRFVNVTQDTYFWVIMVQIGTFSTGIICALFTVLLGSWPAGYVYMIYCFVMMNVCCGMGTLIEVSNESLTYACYNDIPWHYLSIKEKKLLQIMLMMTQNTQGLTVGAMFPLSMNTSLRVTNTIYSIAMMLFNFAV